MTLNRNKIFESYHDDEFLSFVLKVLYEEKAEDVVSFDLKKRSAISDFVVIASGNSSRRVVSIAEKLISSVKELPNAWGARVEGREQGDWVLLDLGSVIVHLFRPEVREYYKIEKIWEASEAESIEIPWQEIPRGQSTDFTGNILRTNSVSTGYFV
jgi:ribosome-associated protein